MNYIQWNNAIGSYFFNSGNSDKNIFLYADKKTIINIGKTNLPELDEVEIWSDFLNAIREGLPGSPDGNLLDKALYSYYEWKKDLNQISNYTVDKPLYIAYLVTFVVPLTSYPGEFQANSYYPIAQRFTTDNNLPNIPCQKEYNNWNLIWKDLEKWSIIDNNLELGIFELHKFKIRRWKYVGKPLSQCLVPTSSLNKLPLFFDVAGLIPNAKISSKTFRNLLLRHGYDTLGLSWDVISLIKDESSELGQSLINIITKAYDSWTGVTDQIEDDEEVKKGWTISRLYLCLKLDTKRDYSVDFYYRLYSINEFPDDLCFNRTLNCYQQTNNWSKPVNLPYQNQFEVTDIYNNWKARFPEKAIRIFVSGEVYHLNHWIETNKVIHGFEFLLLVKENILPAIKDWIEKCEKNEVLELNNVPENFHLFKIKNPTVDHPSIDELIVPSNISIRLTGGIKVDRNSYLINHMPVVELENGNGNERLYICYYGEEDKFFLDAYNAEFCQWELPGNIRLNCEFNVFIEGINLDGFNKRYKIIDDTIPLQNIDYKFVPHRDKFGQVIIEDGNPAYAVGSLAKGVNYRRQEPYLSEFYPLRLREVDITELNIDDPVFIDDIILNYLTIKNVANSKEYFELFEYLYFNRFSLKTAEEHPPLSFLKRSSLNTLDYLGHIDYEYSKGNIYLTHPQLILIPCKNGVKTLLIGARTKELINELREKSIVYGLDFQMKPQNNSVEYLMLPASVTITAKGKINSMHPDRIFEAISKDCGINYNSKELPQFGLNELSGTIKEYLATLIEDKKFHDFNWIMKIFNPNSLKFEKATRHDLNPSLSLVEYKLNEYKYKHRLWMGGKVYFIDKNWGRFIILNKLKRNIIFNDRNKNILAIPTTTPLPRLLAEALLLQSGRAPVQKWLKIDNTECFFNIYENTIHNLAFNSFRKIGQTVLETNLEL